MKKTGSPLSLTKEKVNPKLVLAYILRNVRTALINISLGIYSFLAHRIPPRKSPREQQVPKPMINDPDIEYSVEVEIVIPPGFIEDSEPPALIDLIEHMIAEGTGLDKENIKVRKFVNKTPVSRGLTGIA